MHVIQPVFPFPKMSFLHTLCSVPCLSDGTSSAGQEPSHTPFTLIPYPWRGTGRAGRRRAPEWDDSGDEEERGSLRKGKREGVGAEQGESFSRGRLLCCGVQAEARQASVTYGLLCREPPALVICCGTRHPCPFFPCPFSQQGHQVA